MEGRRVAIVGSRDFHNYDFLAKTVVETLNHLKIAPSVIISGGASGADQLAERFAREYGLQTLIFPANWSQYGRRAGAIRNQQIVDQADILFAFRINNSPGTTITINMAEQKGIPTFVIDT